MDLTLTARNYRCFDDAHPLVISLSPGVTAFVGPNNAGKSSALRLIYEMRDVFGDFRNPQVFLQQFNSGRVLPAQFTSVKDAAEIRCNSNERPLVFELEKIIPELGGRARVSLESPSGHHVFNLGILLPGYNETTLRADSQGRRASLRTSSGNVPGSADLLADIARLADTLYIGSFRNALNISSDESYFDIQVGRAFIKRWRDLKNGFNKHETGVAVRLQDLIARLFGFDHLEINAAHDESTLQLIVDRKSYRLDEVGSGIAHCIVTLINAALRRPAWILIDEPELGLHPTLQLEFLSALASYASHGMMFATHSMGLARSAAHRIYSVRREKGAGSIVRPLEYTPNLSELLGELSFSAHRELGCDTLLLVEGPTEVATVRHFLRMVGKDHRVLLVPLGGGSGINGKSESTLADLTRLGVKVAALVDSERTGAGADLDKAHSDFEAVCTRLGFPCCILERRATENYLAAHAIRKVKGNNSLDALAPFDRLSPAVHGWTKQDNGKIAFEMVWDDIKDTDLGAFLGAL